jgi:hypothetical protein
VSNEDRELWEYFATMYKNSNKGIKGRGKDRKVGAVSQSPSNSVPSQYAAQHPRAPVHHPSHPSSHAAGHPGSLAAYSMSRGGASGQNMMVNVGHMAPGGRDTHGSYDMFDVDAGHSPVTTSSASGGTMYDEEHARDIPFTDRMY